MDSLSGDDVELVFDPHQGSRVASGQDQKDDDSASDNDELPHFGDNNEDDPRIPLTVGEGLWKHMPTVDNVKKTACSITKRSLIVCGLFFVLMATIVIILAWSGNSSIFNPTGTALHQTDGHRWQTWTLRDRVGDKTRVTIVLDTEKDRVRVDGHDETRNIQFSVSMESAVTYDGAMLGGQCASVETLSFNDINQGPSVDMTRHNLWKFVSHASFADGKHFPGFYADAFDTQCRPSATDDTLVGEDEAADFDRDVTDVNSLLIVLDKVYDKGISQSLEQLLDRARIDPSTSSLVVLSADDGSITYLSNTSGLNEDGVHFHKSSWDCGNTNDALKRQCKRLSATAWGDKIPLCSAVSDFRLAVLMHTENGCRECSAANGDGCECWAKAYRLAQLAGKVACREMNRCRSADIVYPCSSVDVAVVGHPVYMLSRCTAEVWASCPVVYDYLPARTEVDVMATTTSIDLKNE